MKPVMIIAIIGVAGGIAVVMASGLMMIEIPTEKIVSDDFEIQTPTVPIQERMTQPTTIVPSTPDCDKSYPDFCIVPYPPDLDCDEIPASNFRVIGDDAHGFDIDNNGIGCES